MYVDGFVIPVPTENRQAFIDHANGKVTDFRRSVAAEASENVAFSWVEWPDKATRDAAFAKMMSPDFNDPRIDQATNQMPFDGKRMIFGGFVPVVDMGDKA